MKNDTRTRTRSPTHSIPADVKDKSNSPSGKCAHLKPSPNGRCLKRTFIFSLVNYHDIMLSQNPSKSSHVGPHLITSYFFSLHSIVGEMLVLLCSFFFTRKFGWSPPSFLFLFFLFFSLFLTSSFSLRTPFPPSNHRSRVSFQFQKLNRVVMWRLESTANSFRLSAGLRCLRYYHCEKEQTTAVWSFLGCLH